MMPETRSTTLSHLDREEFDIAIIGGGITGAWIALHCSSLGYKTALVERGDFGGETSSASSKLLHGGIRYLQQLQLGKVRESTMERAEYLYAAPHLSSPVPFIVPTYKDLKRSKFLLRSGIAAYQMLGLGQNSVADISGQYDMRIQHFSAEQLNQICDISHLDHTGAIAFPEFHMHDSERTVWAVVDSARAAGATVANYVTAKRINIAENTATGLDVVDNESGRSFSIRTGLVINAAGPWVDSLNTTPRKAKHAGDVDPLIQNFAAGAHVITRQITKQHAIAINTKQKSVTAIDRGGRHIFIIPWRGYSLIGTSYRETEDPNSTESLRTEDLHQLLEAVNETLPTAKLTADDIISAYVGLYPLRTSSTLKSTYQGSGEYSILDHAVEDGIDGWITSLGAKFTTGRALAEKTARLVESKLGDNKTASSKSLKLKLSSAAYDDLEAFVQAQTAAHKDRFSHAQTRHFINAYGSEINQFIDYIDQQDNANALLAPLVDGQPDILGQVAWAMEKELALHLDDILLRRTSLGLLGISDSAISTIADLMAERLQWTPEQHRSEVTQALARQQNIRDTAKEFYREH